MKTPVRLLLPLLLAFPAMAQNWTHVTISDSTGILPSLALDADDNPVIAFCNPSLARARVTLATWMQAAGEFDFQTVFLGGDSYVALVLDHDGEPHITQHIHTQGGELVHHSRDDSAWTTEVVHDLGHDGWSSCPAIDSQNRLHVSTIDPACCSGEGLGVEYQWFDGTQWTHEKIGSEPDVGPWTGTSLALDAGDSPLIAYYDNVRRDLVLAKKENGAWINETVDSNGDVGRYPAMRLDSNGEPAIAYFEYLSGTTGLVKIATHSETGWEYAIIDTLKHVVFSPAPGRISMRIDANDVCHISYCDDKALRYATFKEVILGVETILDFSQIESSLGWETSLALDSQNRPFIAYWTDINGVKLCKFAFREAPPAVTEYRLNAGGTEYRTEGNVLFVGDHPYLDVEGGYGYSGGNARTVHKDITNTEDDRLYQSYREGTFSYFFDIPNGTYDVTCHFAEPKANAAGLRVFDILAEGIVEKEAFDVFTAAGGRLRATTLSFSVEVFDSQLGIDFVPSSGQPPILDGIEIIKIDSEARAVALAEAEASGLDQNYPNPFNPTTAIRYEVRSAGMVSLKVFDVLGREVATLADGYLQPGSYVTNWNGSNEASGTYIYRLATQDGVRIQKMVLLK